MAEASKGLDILLVIFYLIIILPAALIVAVGRMDLLGQRESPSSYWKTAWPKTTKESYILGY